MKNFTLFLLAASLCAPSLAQNKVKNLYTSTHSLNVGLLQDAGQPVQLNRTLFAGYNSICLPMSLEAEALCKTAEGLQVERLAAIKQEGSTLYLYFLDCTGEGIEAGVPYLVYSPKFQTMRAKTELASSISTDIKSVVKTDGQGNKVTFSSSRTPRPTAASPPSRTPTAPMTA